MSFTQPMSILTQDFSADREMLPGEQVLLDNVAAGGEELPPRLDVLKHLAVDRLLHRGQHCPGHRRGQVAVEGAKPGDKGRNMKLIKVDTKTKNHPINIEHLIVRVLGHRFLFKSI